CADRGDMDKAISHFEAALRIRASKPERHYDLGSAFVQMNLGDALARKGRADEAILHYQEAIKLQPNYADAYYNLGSVLFAKSENFSELWPQLTQKIIDLVKRSARRSKASK